METESVYVDDLLYLYLEPLKHLKLYALEYLILDLVNKSNDADIDLPGWYYFEYGVSLFFIGKYQESKEAFYHAMNEDEDYINVSKKYLNKIAHIDKK